MSVCFPGSGMHVSTDTSHCLVLYQYKVTVYNNIMGNYTRSRYIYQINKPGPLYIIWNHDRCDDKKF